MGILRTHISKREGKHIMKIVMTIKEFKKASVSNTKTIVGGFWDTCTADNCVNHSDYTTNGSLGGPNHVVDTVLPAVDEDC